MFGALCLGADYWCVLTGATVLVWTEVEVENMERWEVGKLE